VGQASQNPVFNTKKPYAWQGCCPRHDSTLIRDCASWTKSNENEWRFPFPAMRGFSHISSEPPHGSGGRAFVRSSPTDVGRLTIIPSRIEICDHFPQVLRTSASLHVSGGRGEDADEPSPTDARYHSNTFPILSINSSASC